MEKGDVLNEVVPRRIHFQKIRRNTGKGGFEKIANIRTLTDKIEFVKVHELLIRYYSYMETEAGKPGYTRCGEFLSPFNGEGQSVCGTHCGMV